MRKSIEGLWVVGLAWPVGRLQPTHEYSVTARSGIARGLTTHQGKHLTPRTSRTPCPGEWLARCKACRSSARKQSRDPHRDVVSPLISRPRRCHVRASRSAGRRSVYWESIMFKLVRAAAIASVFAVFTSHATAAPYTAQEIGSFGGRWLSVVGINNSGQIVGNAYLRDGSPAHAFTTGLGGIGITDAADRGPDARFC